MLRRRNEFHERYERFLQDLRNEIVSGTLAPGEFILPENTLSQKYEMSRVSIRKALDELVHEGLIEKIAGKGNRVKLPDEDRTPVVIKLAWFSTSYEIEIVKRIIASFEKKYPFVKVELMLYSEENYTRTLIHSMDEEQGPDVFVMSEMHSREWVESRRTDLLTGYIPPHLLEEGVSYPEVFPLFQQGEQMLAAPFIFSPVVICFNRSIFEKYGIKEYQPLESWDDLLRVAKLCTKAPDEDGMVEHYGFCFSASSNRWPVFLLQNNGQIMKSDRSRSTMANENNIQALEYCLSLMYKEHVSPIYAHGSSHLAEGLFMKERVAMIMSTYYFMNEFRDHSIAWDVMELPRGKQPATLLLGGGLAINARSSHRQVAEKLVDYMTGDEGQRLIKQYGCTIPVLRSAAEDDALLDPAIHPEHYNCYLDVLPHAYPLHTLNLTQSEIELLFDELNLLWAGMETPADTCSRMESLFNERLEASTVKP
ncbi:extracellular solute-binding protein [Paenibacillus sp. FSL K6-1566]|uniref:extracellular solute-binding protein n=1 Tax=Paenibacillus sp. FSL K6-1566 TaxID=2954515 RepID=UPI0031012AAF